MDVSNEFKRLKKSPEETLEYIRGKLRFNIGQQRDTKLRCLGDLRDKTLLTRSVAEQHAERLEKQFLLRWKELSQLEMEKRLRFWTVLHAVIPLDVDETVQSVEDMFTRLRIICSGIRGIEVVAAAELEVVNIDKMKEIASEADEARKLDVIVDMLPAQEKSLFKSGVSSFVLVHFHGIVDLGSAGEENAQNLVSKSEWYWENRYQVELKRLYSTKTLKKNLKDIAAYLTKGGNENLIYKIGFGYDTEDKINRQLLKSGKAKLEDDYAGFENALSLTIDELVFLGNAIERLMMRTGSKTMRNGYLFRGGTRLRPSR